MCTRLYISIVLFFGLPSILLAQPYLQDRQLFEYATYYTLDLSNFDDYLNDVWKDVYHWDSGKETNDNLGNVIGGWKALEIDNVVFDHYTEYGGSWEGFCISRRDFAYDKPDPLNQFTASALGGKAGMGSPYMVAYYGLSEGENACRLFLKDGVSCSLAGMYVTNTQYNVLSLTEGDGFSRKFEKGDWFLLTAIGYGSNGEVTGVSEFYLADFRSENAENHYITKDWRWFDLSSLGSVTTVEFKLSSSDNSAFGMSTPSYFCMDQLTIALVESKKQPENREVCQGDSVVFSVSVDGQDYYNEVLKDGKPWLQWRKDGAAIAGANDSVLIIHDCQEKDAGNYSCYVFNQYQTEQYAHFYNDPLYKVDITGKTAALSVVSNINIVEQPQTAYVSEDQPVLLSVKTNGEKINHQWYKKGKRLDGATDSTLFIEHAFYQDSGAYYCQIENGCTSVYSDTAYVYIQEPSSIYPNPCVQNSNIVFNTYEGFVFIPISMNGVKGDPIAITSNRHTVSLELPIGTYIFEGIKEQTDQNGNTQTTTIHKKIIIQ